MVSIHSKKPTGQLVLWNMKLVHIVDSMQWLEKLDMLGIRQFTEAVEEVTIISLEATAAVVTSISLAVTAGELEAIAMSDPRILVINLITIKCSTIHVFIPAVRFYICYQ